MKLHNDWIGLPEDIREYQAFVYLIKNKLNGRKYIGYKNFWEVYKKPQLKTKTKEEVERLERYNNNLITAKENRQIKNRISEREKAIIQTISSYKIKIKNRIANKKGVKTHVKRQTDFLDYWGSCEELVKDIRNAGEIHFEKTILSVHRTKMSAQYHEAKLQFELGVLESEKYYNQQIRCRFSGYILMKCINKKVEK